jgi:hypothetical protein
MDPVADGRAPLLAAIISFTCHSDNRVRQCGRLPPAMPTMDMRLTNAVLRAIADGTAAGIASEMFTCIEALDSVVPIRSEFVIIVATGDIVMSGSSGCDRIQNPNYDYRL